MPTSLSTANQAIGAAGCILVIVLWALSLHAITVPENVAVAMMGLSTSIVHAITTYLSKPSAPGGSPDFLSKGTTK
jgi:hypothetical protein